MESTESGSSATIIIVEDDEGIRETLQFALELEHYNVVTAENGKVGLERLRAMPPPSLILLDLMMPVMDGWEFAAALKQDRLLAGIPVVLVTAYSDQARAIDSDDVLHKPVDLEALFGVARKYASRQHPAGDSA